MSETLTCRTILIVAFLTDFPAMVQAEIAERLSRQKKKPTPKPTRKPKKYSDIKKKKNLF